MTRTYAAALLCLLAAACGQVAAPVVTPTPIVQADPAPTVNTLAEQPQQQATEPQQPASDPVQETAPPASPDAPPAVDPTPVQVDVPAVPDQPVAQPDPAPSPPAPVIDPAPVVTTDPPVADTPPAAEPVDTPTLSATTPIETAPSTYPVVISPAAPPASDPTPIATAAAPRTLIGMNLAPVGNDSFEFPFIDRFKSFGAWYINGGTYGWYAAVPAELLDANGWPASQPDGTNFVANVILDVPGSAPTTRYVLTWAGTATFSFAGASVVSGDPGRIVIDSPSGGIAMSVTTTSTDPIHDIHIVREDQVAAFAAGEVFNPDFLGYDRHWSVDRTMDWSCTNGSQLAHWADRPRVVDASWHCVPIEVQVALANEVGADLWLNIPAHADDDYIRNAVQLVHDTLAPGLRLRLEYSNEVWNGSFEQSGWAASQATALWGDVSQPAEMYYGLRAAQMAAIARDVFADAPMRLRAVIAPFPGWGDSSMDDAVEAGIGKAGVGTIPSLFRDYAVTTYFGDELGYYPGNEADRPIVLAWAEGGAAGLDLAFQELEHGGLLAGTGSLDWRESTYARQAAKAASWGLSLVAYEGGLSMYWYAAAADGSADARTDLVNRMLADQRMGALYTRMITDFRAAGGVLLNHFNDVGKIGVFGPWAVQQDLVNDTPRSSALKAASGR